MKYLPFENIIYQTKLDSEEILKRINEVVEPKKTFRKTSFFGKSNNHKPYEGSVNRNSFKMSRIIEYRNSFLPIIKGDIEKQVSETKINVKMRLHPFIFGFILIWCGGVGFGFLIILAESIKKGVFQPFILIPFVMLLFAYGMTMLGFKSESIKSKKYLAKLFDAEINEIE